MSVSREDIERAMGPSWQEARRRCLARWGEFPSEGDQRDILRAYCQELVKFLRDIDEMRTIAKDAVARDRLLALWPEEER